MTRAVLRLPAGQLDLFRCKKACASASSPRLGRGVDVAKVLDVCCGPRSMYFDPQDQRVLFGDRRYESIIVTDRSPRNHSGVRILHIHPDVRMDFRALPFADESFPLVVFDPPHLVQAGPRSWLAARYGKLGADWREDLRAGFAECFRVLRPEGTLIFKWNETQVPLRDVLACTEERPLFGHRSGRKYLTHWLTFFKASPTPPDPGHERDAAIAEAMEKGVE